MARVKNGAVTKARHKKVLKAAKGYFGSKHRLYKTAKEQLQEIAAAGYAENPNYANNLMKIVGFVIAFFLILFSFFAIQGLTF